MLRGKAARTMAMLLCLVMVLSSVSFGVVPSNAIDVKGSPAEQVVKAWIQKDLIQLGADNKFYPDREVTRGELAAMINAAFQFTVPAKVGNFDLKRSHPYYKDLLIAKQAGYLVALLDHSFGPNNPVSKQEYAVILARLLKLDRKADLATLSNIKDHKQLPTWSAGSVASVVKRGYMKLDSAGNFSPLKKMTRADLIVNLNALYPSLVKKTYDTKGTYSGNTIRGSVEINSADVVLENTVIDGNLIIGKAVGNGNVSLKNVTVLGKTIVNGGGPNSIILFNVKLTIVVVNKADNNVRLLATGNTTVNQVEFMSGGKLEAQTPSKNAFGSVVVSEEVKSNEPVNLVGNFNTVFIESDAARLNLDQGKIGTVNVPNDVAPPTLNLTSTSVVTKLDASSPVTIAGSGNVATVNVKASDVTVNLTGASKVNLIEVAVNLTNTMIQMATSAIVTTANVKSELDLIGSGNLSNLNVNSSNLKIDVAGSTKIGAFSVNPNANNAQIGLGKDVVVVTLEVSASASLSGDGSITSANVNASGLTMTLVGTMEITTLSIDKNLQNATVNLGKGTEVATMNIDSAVAVVGDGTINKATVTVTGVTIQVPTTAVENTSGGLVSGTGLPATGPTTPTTPPVTTTPVTPPVVVTPPEDVMASSVTVGATGGATTLENGQTLHMIVSVGPSRTTDKSVSWSVATLVGGTATISASGVLTATGAGTVTVTATNTASGISGTKIITITSTTPAIAWSATTLAEATANDGSVSATLTLTLSNDTFVVPGGAMTATTHYTVANVPAGLTAVVTGTSATTATIALTGNAASHANANDVSNLTVTFLNAAFTGANAAAVTNYTKNNLIIDYRDPITIGWSATTFTEAGANDGSITTTVTLTLTNDTFVVPGGVMTDTTHYTKANVPAGLTLVVTGTSATTATVTLTGNAASHANANDVSNLTLTFLNAAVTGGNISAVTNYSKNNLVVDYADPGPSIAWSATTFTEAGSNDGSIATTLTLTLSNDTFVVPGGAMTATTHYTVANVPAGLTAVVTGTSATTATVTLTGNAGSHANADDVSNVTLTFLNAAFTGANAASVTNYSKNNLAVDYRDTVAIAWSATTFTEAGANDGSIATTVTLTLSNDTFVVPGGVMTDTTHYTKANVPAGLTLVVTGTSATTATVTLTGTAAAHANADDVSNLTITFLNAAITAGNASAITNYSKNNLAIDYRDPGSIAWSATTFTEAGANDGSIATTVTLTLSNDTFVVPGGAMTATTHYTVANVPTGLTLVVTGTSATTATVTLTGTAAAHANADDVANLTLTFLNAGITGGNAALVTNYSKNNLAVDYRDPGSIAWSATTFTEAGANDGSIATTVTLTLSNDTFVVSGGAMTATTHYTVANVPTGLTLVVTGTSATTATVTLTGTAAAHANADDVANLTLTFLNAGITGGNAALVTNYSKNNLAVDYRDPGSIAWSATTFTEAGANDGTVDTTVTLTLSNDTFVVPGGAMTATTHYTVANVPTGLTLVVTGTSATTATVTLTGTAAAHANADDVANLTLTFLNAAITGGNIAAVTDYSKTNLAIDYAD